MKSQIELYYDFGSPTSYLAFERLPAIAARYEAEIVLRPILLGGIFKATGNSSPMDIESKKRWMWDDLKRHADRYKVPFRPNPHFPVVTLQLMRLAHAVPPTELNRYSKVVYRALWYDGLNLADPEVVAEVLESAGFDAKSLFAEIGTSEVKEKLKLATDQAVRRGLFGAPTMFVSETMFFGQDRLDFLADALASISHGSASGSLFEEPLETRTR